MTSIAVVGPGGVGTFFAAHLAALGHDVTACARRPFDRYVVESASAPVDAPATVVTDPSSVPAPFDWVLVGVKAHQSAGAAPWLDRCCGNETTVVVMQNGVEGHERLAPLVNGAEVIASVVYCGAELRAPGHTMHESAGFLIVPEGESSERLAALFAGSPAKIRVSDAYLTELWRKLAINVVVNGLTALTGKPISVVGEPAVRDIARRIMAECFAVARAEGAELDDATIEPTLGGMGRAGGITSMLQDRRAGRGTEWDALYGAVGRYGTRHGIPTPTNDMIGALVAAGDPAT